MPCFVDLEMRVTLSGRDHDGGCFECDPRASDSPGRVRVAPEDVKSRG